MSDVLGAHSHVAVAAMRAVWPPDARRRVPMVSNVAPIRSSRAQRVLGVWTDRARCGARTQISWLVLHCQRDCDAYGTHGLARRCDRGATRAHSRSARAQTRAPTRVQSERATREGARAALAIAGVERRVAAHALHRDANAVDTRGATSQRFGRVSRHDVGAKPAPRRARGPRGRRCHDRGHTGRVRCRALRGRRTHC
jgi:hypothetical protein